MTYVIERHLKNPKKYIVKFEDGTERYFFFKGKKKLVKPELDRIGIEEFLKQYEIEGLEGRKKKKKLNNSGNNSLIEELKALKTEVCLKMWGPLVTKGSPEHRALKEELHRIHDELVMVPGYESWDQKMSHMSSEDLADLQAAGEQKKREKKQKPERIKKVTI